MEPKKARIKSMPLRKAFILYVLTAFALVVAVSGTVIWGCLSVQKWLLPDSNEVFLNIEQTFTDGTKATGGTRIKIGSEPGSVPMIMAEGQEMTTLDGAKFSITSVESGVSLLSPKRRLLYQGCSVAMVAVPVFLSLSGILFCGFAFYKKKLKTPIALLARATDQITKQDLDFKISYPAGDELGALCVSFEQMRLALQENNRKMWEMLEERRRLQASVAHDLRNPIAIIEGHAEYLLLNLPTGNLDSEKIASIAGNIGSAAKRLEGYTESIRTINHLEELEPVRRQVDFTKLHDDMIADFVRMAEPRNLALRSENLVADRFLSLDSQMLYRILENLMGNAVRYAKNEIFLSFSHADQKLSVSVADDGPGFSEKILNPKHRCFLADCENSPHTGMGLTICRILCNKHGGCLSLANRDSGGACVRFTLAV